MSFDRSSRFCVVIPAYREEGRIGNVVRSVLPFCRDVVVVDDGSDDATGREAAEAGAIVLVQPSNMGKALALKRAFSHAREHGFECALTMDGDGQHDAADIPGFLDAYDRHSAPVVVGNRMADPRGMPFVRRMTNIFMSRLLSRRMGQRVPDTQCGYRLMRCDLLPDPLPGSERFAGESESLIRMSGAGVKFSSAPVKVIYRDEKSKINPIRDTVRFIGMLRRLEGLAGAGGAAAPAVVPVPALAARALLGGLMMGLANLVPGISGGTMLLASGVYPAFIDGIAELTTLRFRARSLVVLGCVAGSAGVAILLLAGPVKGLVVDRRWVMYSIFIGLTLGGLPVVWRMIGRAEKAVWWGAAAGFIGMAALAWVQAFETGGGAVGGSGPLALFFAGIIGASAMILPGVSGGYLLLVLGQYVPILAAIDRFKEAVERARWAEAWNVGVHVGLPVGLGVVLGIAGVSNLLKMLLKRYREATLGVLLGLLLGAVVGLWPFQKGVPPREGDTIKGAVMTAESIAQLSPEDYPIEFFRPSAGQAGLAVLAVLGGIAVTLGVAKLGGGEQSS